MNSPATLRALLAITLTLHSAVLATAPALAARQPTAVLGAPPLGPTQPELYSTLRDGLLIDVNSNNGVNAGDTLRYTATVSSTVAVSSVYFTATLDANTLFAGGSMRMSPLAQPEQYSLQRNTGLAVGAPGVLANDTGSLQPAVTAETLTTDAGGVVTVTATGAFTYTPPLDYTGTDAFTYTIGNALGSDSARVDLEVQATPEPNRHIFGAVRTGGAKVIAALSMRNAAIERSQGKEGSAEEVYATIGNLAHGKLVTITFDVLVTDPLPAEAQHVAAQGSIGAANASPVLTDDPDTSLAFDPTATSLDVHADLAVSKHVNVAGALPGQRITYTLAYTNNGPDMALGAVLTDVIPAEFASPQWTSSHPAIQQGETPYAWSLGNLASGETGLIQVSVVVIPAVRHIVVNTATVSSGTPDDSAVNNISAIDFEVQNATPLVKDDVVTTTEGVSVTIFPLSNDSDYNNDVLSLVGAGVPPTGSITFTPPAITYWPASYDFGTRVFTYTVSDGSIAATATITVNVLPTNDAPQAVTSANLTATVYSSVTLHGAASSDVDGPLPLSYLWQQVAGAPVGFDPTLSTTTFTAPGAAGDLAFTLIVTDGAGRPSAPATATVTIIDSALSVVSIDSNSPVLLGAAATLTASTPGSNATFVWHLGDGTVLTRTGTSSVAGSMDVLTHTHLVAGVYTVTVTATNGMGSAAAETQIVVRDHPLQGLQVFSSAPTTVGKISVFSATASGSGISYTWDFGDGNQASGRTVSNQYAAPGTYTAVVTATNSSGTLSEGIAVTIYPTPTARLQSAAMRVPESAGSVPITVMLDTPASVDITVTVIVTDGSAVAPQDYTAVIRDIMIPAGATTATHVISVAGDSTAESDESVFIHLTQADGAALGTPASAVLTITNDDAQPPPAARKIYLPLMMHQQAASALPDLVVERISTTNGELAVVVKNIGGAPVTDAFWVDAYVNPNPPPQQLNHVWHDGRSARGAVWGVDGAGTLPLAPGQSLTLTLDSPLLNPALSVLPGLSPGDVVYAQADSASTIDAVNGAVRESHEASGAAYNNISSIQVTLP